MTTGSTDSLPTAPAPVSAAAVPPPAAAEPPAAAPPRATAAAAATAVTFEAALRELEQVVEQLEIGSPGLEEALRLYERGSQLVADCQRILAQAELRVVRLAAETATPLGDATAPPSDQP